MNLKDLRSKHGYSQEGLSQISGIGLRTIQRIENGTSVPRNETLQKLANALGEDIKDIYSTVSSKELDSVKRITIISSVLIIQPLLAILVTLIISYTNNKLSQNSRQYLNKLIITEIAVFLLFFLSALFIVSSMEFSSSFNYLKALLGFYLITVVLGISLNIFHFKRFKNKWLR